MKKQSANYVDGFVLVVPKNKRAIYKKMAKDPNYMKNMPFDMKKMSYGGFKVIVGS